MPTYNEFSKQYSQRILTALQADGLSRFSTVTENKLRGSETLTVLKSIKREIDNLVHEGTDTKLSVSEKNVIYRGLSKELHLSSFQTSINLCEAASNDDLTDLVDEIDNILRENK